MMQAINENLQYAVDTFMTKSDEHMEQVMEEQNVGPYWK